MPDPIKNLIEMVKKGWETATDGIERPVRISGLPGRPTTNSLFLDKRILFEYER